MKAVVYDRYGPPDVLRVEDVPVPSPGRRAGAGQGGRDVGQPQRLGVPARLAAVRAPRRAARAGAPDRSAPTSPGGSTPSARASPVPRPATRCTATTSRSRAASPSTRSPPESALAPKPAGLTFAEASTIPQAAPIALQGTDGAAAGRRVLINGAGGGSGSFAIQLAKRLGAHVTGVDNAGKLDFMRSLGADEVIDYRREDFTRARAAYDLILDLVAHRSVFAYRRALAPGGRYRCVGGPVRTLLRILTVGPRSPAAHRPPDRGARRQAGPAHFEPLAELCVAGDVGIHIDRTFGLDDVPEALAHVGEGRALGKVVITVAD